MQNKQDSEADSGTGSTEGVVSVTFKRSRRRGDVRVELDVEVTPDGSPLVRTVVVSSDASDGVRRADLSTVAREFERLAVDAAVVVAQRDHGFSLAGVAPGPTMTRRVSRREAAATDGALGPAGAEMTIQFPQSREEVHTELNRRRSARLTNDDYRRVAQTYLAAERAGESIHEAVATVMGVTQSRAAQLIGEARRRGLLDPAKPGRRPRSEK